MTRTIALLLALGLSGCGLGETAGTTAAVGAAKKAELDQAQAGKEKLVKDLDQAGRQADERLRAAEGK